MWKAVATPGSKTYYYHTQTNESVWDKPKELWTPLDHKLTAANWTTYETAEGRPYWYNSVTSTSVWECPITEAEPENPKTFEDLCKDFVGVPFADAMEPLSKHPQYWELDFVKRVQVYEKETQLVSESDLRERLKTEYLSANQLFKLTRNEDLVRRLLKDYELDPAVIASLKQALEQEQLEDLSETESRLHEQLGYPRDPRLIQLYKDRFDLLKAQREQSQNLEAETLEIEAAKARLAFLAKLDSMDLTKDWMELAPSLSDDISTLKTLPGSTALQLFNERKATYLSSTKEDLRTAEEALQKANKSLDRISFETFSGLVKVRDPKRIYEQLRGDQVKRPRLEATLEY